MIALSDSLLKRGASVLLIIAVITSCSPVDQENALPPILSVASADLLLDTSSFPNGWQAEQCEESCERGKEETEASRSFYVPNVAGHVIQDVFRLTNVRDAKEKFQTYREAEFRKSTTRNPSTEFVPPSDIAYRSLVADEYYIGCGVDVTPSCKVIARYTNFFVFIYLDVDSGIGDGLKLAQIEPILRSLDERFAPIVKMSETAVPFR